MRFFYLIVALMFSSLCFSQSAGSASKKADQNKNPLDRYTEVYSFQNGLAQALMNRQEDYAPKYGVVDEEGNELIPVVYDVLELVKQGENFKDNVYRCKMNGKLGLVSSQNDVLLPCDYDELSCIDGNIWRISREGKYGYVVLNGTSGISAKIRCIYSSIGEYSATGPIHANYHGKEGIINSANNIVIPFEFSKIGDFNANGLAWVEKDGKYGVYSKSGRQMQPCNIEEAYCLSPTGNKQTISFELVPTHNEQEFMYLSSNGKKGLMDLSDGKPLVPCIYEYLSPVINGKLFYKIGGKWGIIDKDNHTIQQAVYEKVLVNKKELTEQNIPDSILRANMYVSQNKQWGMLTKDGNVLIPTQYELLGKFSDGMVLAKKEGSQYGYINDKGQEAVPFIYSYVANFSDGLAAVKDEKGKYLFIDKTGEVVIKPHAYDSVEKFVDGKCRVVKNGKTWEIDKEGKKVKD